MVLKFWLLPLLISAIIIDLCHTAKNDKCDYMFTSPRTLKIGSINELQFLRFDCIGSGRLHVKIQYDQSQYSKWTVFEKTFDLEEGQKNTSLNIFVQPFENRSIKPGVIEINGTIGDDSFKGSEKVYFSTSRNSIYLIQTDKYLYKPGQTVQFRVLKLNKDLKPSNKETDEGIVFVEDAKGTRLFEFKKVPLGKGIRQLEFPLSEEPVLGTWKITLKSNKDSESSNFQVKEYELPTFEVKIIFPPYVHVSTELIPLQICAKYTFGKPVEGDLALTLSVVNSSVTTGKNGAVEEFMKIKGCLNYTLQASRLDRWDSRRVRKIQITATVMEEGTGSQINETEFMHRKLSPINLNFMTDSSSNKYFKPGLPYIGKIQAVRYDNSPARKEDIEVCIQRNEYSVIESMDTSTIKTCKNYTSNENGVIEYIISPTGSNTTAIELEVKSVNYANHHPQPMPKQVGSENTQESDKNKVVISTKLKRFYSPSGSYIQLQKSEGFLTCNDATNLELLFTTKVNKNHKFYYQVVKEGKILYSGEKQVIFKKETDDISSTFKSNSNTNRTKRDRSSFGMSDYEYDDSFRDYGDYGSDSENSRFESSSSSKIELPDSISSTSIPIQVTSSLSPSFSLLVFYIRNDGEVVADSQTYKVQKCYKNKVRLEFGDEIKQPGTKTSVKISASPHSLCGIKVVDKSAMLLGAGDGLTADKVFLLAQKLDTNRYDSGKLCNERGSTRRSKRSRPRFNPNRRPFRPWPTISENEDSFTSFQTSGLLVISNLKLFTRPCARPRPTHIALRRKPQTTPARMPISISMPMPISVSTSSDGFEVKSTKSIVEVRDFFPETWLFEMEEIGSDGTFITKKKLPHTITEWVGNAVCVSSEDGIGISNHTSIRSFQAFFISYTLPTSVVRGEEFWLVISIFNYADDALPITISLDQLKGLEVSSDPIDGDVCVQPEQSSNLRVKLKAMVVGDANITVRAETASAKVMCSGSNVSNSIAKDAITKSIKIEAEGFPVENATNFLFCPTDIEDQHFNQSIKLDLPEDVVPYSARAVVDVTGNVIGPAMQNLNNLVKLPTGCGEQNMVKFNPNYLALDYMASIGKLDEKIKSAAISNLNKGYQRELTYQRKDGSFSAFGESDRHGSMFLTAFVLRSFVEAKRYITIDKQVLIEAQNWIVSKQQASGCFPEVGFLLSSSLQGGLHSGSTSITAYVVTSLLLSKYENQSVIERALNCIRDTSSNLKPYETFLYAYAEALAGNKKEAKKLIDAIKPSANTSDGMEHYEHIQGSRALNLETVAYAVLAHFEIGSNANEIQPLVRYMTKNMNPQGGFYSTQDTCVGLEAMSKFSKLLYRDPVDILVTLSGALNKEIEISEENKILVQRNIISRIPNHLEVEAAGSGCGLIQTTVRYNTKTSPEQNKFHIEVFGECSNALCKRKTVNVAVRFKPVGQKTGMSVVQIKMISGTVPIKESLKKLMRENDKELNISRFDVEANEVVIYFPELSNKKQEFSFEVKEEVEVENPQPASVTVFDYYAPEISTTTKYSF